MQLHDSSCRLAVALVAAAIAVAVGPFGPAPAAAQQFTMKISTPTIRGQLEEWGRLVKVGVEKRTGGRMKVETYPASQLGSIPRTIEGAQLGTIEAVEVPAEFLSGIDERFAIFSAPAVLTGLWQGTHALNDPEFKKAFWSVGQDKGIKIVGQNCDAFSDYATRGPIRTMDDFQGLKLRVFGSPLEREALSRLGATGVPMPLGEVLPAIQRHTIDGNKSGITVFVPFKYYNTVKYVFKARESMICVLKFLSKPWFELVAEGCADHRLGGDPEGRQGRDAVHHQAGRERLQGVDRQWRHADRVHARRAEEILCAPRERRRDGLQGQAQGARTAATPDEDRRQLQRHAIRHIVSRAVATTQLPRHCERSEAIQSDRTVLDCFGATRRAMTKGAGPRPCAIRGGRIP